MAAAKRRSTRGTASLGLSLPLLSNKNTATPFLSDLAAREPKLPGYHIYLILHRLLERVCGAHARALQQNTFTNADPFPFGMPGGMQFGHGGVQVGFGPFMPFMGWGFQANFGGQPAQGNSVLCHEACS
jgi:hypothetical protein